MPRRADPERIRRRLRCTREGNSATYRVVFGESPTPWKIIRNDNELGPGGNRGLAWELYHDEVGALYETGRRSDALDHLAKRYANLIPMREDYR